jgi:hypothetical protein
MERAMIFENIIPKINPIGIYIRKIKMFSIKRSNLSS